MNLLILCISAANFFFSMPDNPDMGAMKQSDQGQSSKEEYLKVVRELEKELYTTA